MNAKSQDDQPRAITSAAGANGAGILTSLREPGDEEFGLALVRKLIRYAHNQRRAVLRLVADGDDLDAERRRAVADRQSAVCGDEGAALE